MRAVFLELKPPRLALLALFILAFAATACRSSDSSEKPSGLIVINATVTGTVRRVLAKEGAPISENAVIIEIAEQTATQAQPQAETDRAQAQAASVTAQGDIRAAEAEAERAAVEVQRVQSLVARGSAAQAELDAARAQYQHAQEKLQRAKDAAQSAQRNLTLQQSRPESQSPPKPSEQIVTVRAPSSGIVRVISVRAGERVTAGQAIATVAATN